MFRKLLAVPMAATFVLAAVALWPVDAGAAPPRELICHIPPSNPDNRRVITVGAKSVDKHIFEHGDVLFGAEVCDGLDNDCDGRVDNGFPTTVAVVSDPAGSPFGYVDLSLSVQPEDCSSVCDDTFINFPDLPPFTYAGVTYTDLVIGSNGFVVAGTDTSSAASNANQDMPDLTTPNAVLAPFWTDLDLDGTSPDDSGAGRIYKAILDSDNLIVVEWRDVEVWNVPGPNYTFQLWIATDLSSNPGIWFVYHDLDTLPTSLSIGAESDGALLGDTWHYNGTGTPPITGDDGDLKVLGCGQPPTLP